MKKGIAQSKQRLLIGVGFIGWYLDLGEKKNFLVINESFFFKLFYSQLE